ncbi:hypothetical protein [Streptomyces longisporoflavus]|uniref:Uncharacterized protein n=1 Tax=Streptomyces longisporoflavus TaxID=28044 RepID=A0ABW7R844_9ACTN|nr:hypothetical protein [Streptomyces longisporoflavus]GGV63273.1 hypothetical protein GCM10010277_69290 [Streptomyces longisporoflavus]
MVNTATIVPKATGRDVPQRASPLRSDDLRFVLVQIIARTPLDGAAICHGPDTAVGNQTPPPAVTTADLDLARRLALAVSGLVESRSIKDGG